MGGFGEGVRGEESGGRGGGWVGGGGGVLSHGSRQYSVSIASPISIYFSGSDTLSAL